MSESNGQQKLPFVSKEEEYEQVLLVKVRGFGSDLHRINQAQRVKQILEVALHEEVSVMLAPGKNSEKWVAKSFPVQRKDRNAYIDGGTN